MELEVYGKVQVYVFKSFELLFPLFLLLRAFCFSDNFFLCQELDLPGQSLCHWQIMRHRSALRAAEGGELPKGEGSGV